MTKIQKIKFHDTEILTIDRNGKSWVLFRPLVEALGLDAATQREKIKAADWAEGLWEVTEIEADGVSPSTSHMLVARHALYMWLATIDSSRVAEGAREGVRRYQRELPGVLEAYFEKGVAINPRASTKDIIEALDAAKNLLDRNWLAAKAQHVLAQMMGEEPEVPAERRPLTVGEYLEQQGVKGSQLRTLSPRFGKALAAMYIATHGHAPPKVERFVDGALRGVKGYTEADRPLFDAVYKAITG